MQTEKHWIGVDFGGTNLRAAVVNLENGSLSHPHRLETPALEGPRAVMDQIARLVEQVIQASGYPRTEFAAVGIGCPASMDMKRGNIRNAPNVIGDWPSIEFKREMEASLHLPVAPLNDVRAITLGEVTFGAGKEFNTVAVYAIGTGLGGGVAINGRLHLGVSGSAGEFGHMIVDPFGLPCNCGSRGCLETIVSGNAISAQAAHAIVMRKKTSMSDLVKGDINRINPSIVIEAAKAGDAVACHILENAGVYLGISIANILVTLSPQRILIGGGVAAAGELLLEPARRTVRERTHMVPLEEVEIVSTSLGENAGLLGSALWAMSQQQETVTLS
jgi:glucokinase